LNEFLSTPDQIRTFIDSVIWSDLSQEIRDWLDDIRNQLETVQDREEFNQLQGSAKACRYFLDLPKSLLETMEINYGNTDQFE
jgi:hypothetical protein